MRFQVLGHACLLVEHRGVRLLVDPWLFGSCYWRSWWHFPEPVPPDERILAPDYIYLSHQHFDHFHYPSMRRFARDTPVLVAKFPLPGMEDGLRDLGFTNITALPHGKTRELAGGLRVTSYQAGWIDDSALVVEGGGTCLLDLNDAKFEEPVLRQIGRRHGPVDFLFKQFSSADAYPDRYRSDDPADLSLYTPDDMVNNFIADADRLRPRYAVPFASGVCHLHPDVWDSNAHAVSPLTVEQRFREHPPPGSEAVVMLPGASWDSERGFALVSTEVLERQDEELERLRAKNAPRLEAQERQEAAKTLRFETFEAYMGAFLRSLPWGLKLIYSARVAFQVPAGGGQEWWVLDFARRRVERLSQRPSDVVAVVEIEPGLLQDAMEKDIVNFVSISKRLTVHLAPGKIVPFFIFRELITLYEMGYFPLWRKAFSARVVGVWWSRRKELLSYLGKARRGGKAFVPRAEAAE